MKPIEEEIKNIISYVSNKHPFLRVAVNNCDYEISGNTITLKFRVPVSTMFRDLKYDREIREGIKSFYGKSYNIKFVDNVDADELIRLQVEEEKKRMSMIRNEIRSTGPSIPKDTTPTVPSEGDKGKDDKKSGKMNNPFLILGRNSNIKESLIRISDASPEEGRVALYGEISNMETKELRSGKILVSFDLYDGTGSLTCKSFLKPEQADDVISKLKKARGVKLCGNLGFSNFSGEVEMIANTIVETKGLERVVRRDESEVKRVELHLHTKMSQMDGMSSAADLIKRAMSWGMKSIAITDHGVVQSFPEAHKLLGRNNPDMKVIYGVEAYLAPDKKPSVRNIKGQSLDTTYCVLDLETTGFSPRLEKITEIGVMKYQDGKVIDKFSCFVNPEKSIPPRVVEVTGITDDMVRNAETIDKVFPKLLEFIKDSVLVAHNAEFDVGFLRHVAKELGYEFDFTYLDTLSLAYELFPEYKTYKLGRIAKNLGIKVDVAHRALDDVDTTVKVFKVMLDMLKERGVNTLEDIEIYASDETAKKEAFKKLRTHHAIILAKDYVGLKNLYKLVSYSHLDYFYKKPRILRSMFKKYSEGLIIGSACSDGELYQSILLGKSDEEIEAIAREYDYLEIQPLGNNDYLIRNGEVPDKEYLREINRKIVALGEKLNLLLQLVMFILWTQRMKFTDVF